MPTSLFIFVIPYTFSCELGFSRAKYAWKWSCINTFYCIAPIFKEHNFQEFHGWFFNRKNCAPWNRPKNKYVTNYTHVITFLEPLCDFVCNCQAPCLSSAILEQSEQIRSWPTKEHSPEMFCLPLSCHKCGSEVHAEWIAAYLKVKGRESHAKLTKEQKAEIDSNSSNRAWQDSLLSAILQGTMVTSAVAIVVIRKNYSMKNCRWLIHFNHFLTTFLNHFQPFSQG